MKSNKPIHGLFFINETGSHCWRADGIANRLNRDNSHDDGILVLSYKQFKDNLAGANLVIFEMLRSPRIASVIKSQGAKLIYEADDAMLDTYGKDERKNLTHMGDKLREDTIATIQQCDAMTVTSERLKENYARFFDGPIYVLPNYVDYEWYGDDTLNIDRNTDEIRIGWFGSKGHLEDLHMVTPALKNLLDKYPNLKFVYCGFGGMSSDSKVTEIGWGEDVFKPLPRSRREFHMGVREDLWPMKHRYLDLDIGIAPLIDDEFNWNKTPIKWMEYSILGTPSVCSPVLYGDVVDHGNTGFIANSVEEWVENLSLLIENPDLRNKVGRSAKNEVKKKHNLDDHWTKWADVYREVLDM